MPTYDYKCQACDHHLEAFHSMTAEPLTECPACGEPKLKKMIGPGAGLLFKGSGFYQTDYRSDSYKKGAQSESPSKNSETSKKETSSKDKKAATPASKKNK